MWSVSVSGSEEAKKQATANSREGQLEKPEGTKQGLSLRQGGCAIIPMNEKVNLRRIIGMLCFYPAVKLKETLSW